MTSAPPTVVFATTVFEAVDTGPGIYARYLWDAFREDRDLAFHLVAPGGPGVPDIRRNEPRLHRVDVPAKPRLLYDAVAAKALEVAAQAEPGGSVILHGNAAHAMARARGTPFPWIVQVNDYDAAEVWRKPATTAKVDGLRRLGALAWRHRREGAVLREATLSLCNSAFTRDRVLDCYPGLDPRRLRVVTKAVDTDAFRRPRQLPGDPLTGHPRGCRILFIGAAWRRKRLPDLIQALPRIAAFARDVRLIVVGPGDDQRSEIMALVRAVDAEDRVVVLGKVDRVSLAGVYWHCDMLVLPSEAEALGVSILEAMAAGLPVVASRVGGIPEIIRDDGEGVLVAPRDPVGLAEAITAVLREAARRRQLADAGPRRAADFSVGAMTAAVKSIYLELAAGAARGGGGQRRAAAGCPVRLT